MELLLLARFMLPTSTGMLASLTGSMRRAVCPIKGLTTPNSQQSPICSCFGPAVFAYTEYALQGDERGERKRGERRRREGRGVRAYTTLVARYTHRTPSAVPVTRRSSTCILHQFSLMPGIDHHPDCPLGIAQSAALHTR